MRKTFKHLDFHARDRVEILWKAGHEQKDIALVLGVDKSTVSREIQGRKKQDGTYSAGAAEHKAGIKRSNSKYQGMKIETCPSLRKFVISELKQRQSPECIAGRMREKGMTPRVSGDAIYRWLRSSFGQRYCKYLCAKRYRKKLRTCCHQRHVIANMTSIHAMPPDLGFVVEGDTFLSPKKASKTAVALLGWRDSKLLKGEIVKSLRPVHTTKVMRRMRAKHAIDAMILDQGIENMEHEQFGVPTYFCDKASPRQKPFIESSIGLLRRWFWPKGTNLRLVSKEELEESIEILNNKYRKSLRYRSANEVSRECGILRDN